MKKLSHLFDKNIEWADHCRAVDPDFFKRLINQQSPEYLWIGCSDSRVPANEIVGLAPGELFVHRNVANLVVHSDLNCLSVMQFAVDVLKVKHIIVCGHYGCGGVKAAMENDRHGLVDNWICHIKDVQAKFGPYLQKINKDLTRQDKLCELNVIEQAKNVCRTTIVEDAWARGQELYVHAWVYAINDGVLRDLRFCVDEVDKIDSCYQNAVDLLTEV